MPEGRNTLAAGPAITVEHPERSSAFLLGKRAVQAACWLLVLPRWLTYRIAAAALGRNRAFLAASEGLARIPGERGVLLRQAFYRRALERCGQDVYVGFATLFSMTEARLGDRVYIGRQCSLGFADIGHDALLADAVVVLSGGHEHGQPDGTSPKSRTQSYSRVSIGAHAWIGSHAVIMADVGEGAMVGAGAVVNRPVPPNTVAAGVPARVVRELTRA